MAHDEALLAGADLVADPSDVDATGSTWRRPLPTMIAGLRRSGASDRAMWAVWAAGLAVLLWYARQQWFLRDDWAFIFTRERMRAAGGVDGMLLWPQDGHWMTWPLLVFWLLRSLFGLGSYLPYILVLLASHVAIVVLVRRWFRRFGVSEWTSVGLSAVLLVFGAGWENLVFAVQIVYNFSLIAFLAQMLLVDHDGPVDRRDWLGAGCSLIGVSSSGFGPFFGLGVTVLLVLRRRWRAALLAVGPQAIAWIWWWTYWGGDPAGDRGSARPRFVADFVETGTTATAGSLIGVASLGLAAFLACIAIVLWRNTDRLDRTTMIAFIVTVIAMFAGIGARREIFGVQAAAWPRYQYVAAMLLAPILGLALDQVSRFASWARWVPRVLLAYAVARNVTWLDAGSDVWVKQAELDRRMFSLVAGSERRLEANPYRGMSQDSPDVLIIDLEALVKDGAIEPAEAVTEQDEATVSWGIGIPLTEPTPTTAPP